MKVVFIINKRNGSPINTCALKHADDLAAVRHGYVGDEASSNLGAPGQGVITWLQEGVWDEGHEEQDASRRCRRVGYHRSQGEIKVTR